MKKYELFIGIDISKKWIDVSITNDGKKDKMIHRRFSNSEKGFKKLMAWIKSQKIKWAISGCSLFCMEHTGVYTFALCAFLEHHQMDFVMESALRIKRSLGITRGKSDKADSKDIARYAFLHAGSLKISVLPAGGLMKLKNLLTHRALLVKQRTMLKSSTKEFHAFMPQEFIPELMEQDSKQLISILSTKIQAIEKTMLSIVKQDQELTRLYELVKSVKGIGLIISITLLVYTNCFKAFESARKFACYIAIAPFAKSSGTSLNIAAKVGKMGYTKIKALLSNACASALQHDKQLKAYYNRKIEQGKEKGCVLNAVKNKLVARIFAVVKRGTPFVDLNNYA